METNKINICYCCKEKKEVISIRVTETETNLVKSTDKDVNVNRRFVCNDCNHFNIPERV